MQLQYALRLALGVPDFSYHVLGIEPPLIAFDASHNGTERHRMFLVLSSFLLLRFADRQN